MGQKRPERRDPAPLLNATLFMRRVYVLLITNHRNATWCPIPFCWLCAIIARSNTTDSMSS
jgi:hypothetical protein